MSPEYHYHSDEKFLETWKKLKSPSLVARELGISERAVYNRRRALESKFGTALPLVDRRKLENKDLHKPRMVDQTPPATRHGIDINDGVVIVFSDAHFVPNEFTVAHKALLYFIKELKPKVVVCNGDAFDGGVISRFPRIGWDNKPTVMQELQACQEALETIEKASKGAQLVWTMGNHDARFETFLANVAPQYEGIKGFHLKDHFPFWKPCWSLWINDRVVIKHRHRGGSGAARNNTIAAGTSIVTGHTHILKVHPHTDYLGTRYGVETGTLADPNGPQFVDYTEDAPKDWRSGFAVLTFHKGDLLLPELVQVRDEESVEFRGKVWNV